VGEERGEKGEGAIKGTGDEEVDEGRARG